mmetsp:Transcript_32927/g.49712  ORF Transcript_32927/g.49712 Transcript_32927/m.49712 type:complete len:606 (+) Transcript_32927:23-1840(+)
MDSISEKSTSASKPSSLSPHVRLKHSSPLSANKHHSLNSPASASRKDSTTFTTSFLQTPSGPVLTPNRDNDSTLMNNSTTMILLSPSRTIAESLTALASSTAQQLEQVWDEVGYNSEERASQLSDLLRQFRSLCDEKISEERGVADTFRSEIRDAQKELKETKTALKEAFEQQSIDEQLSGLSLTDQLSSLEQSLEAIREEANLAREDLTECRQLLIEAHEALGISLEEKWLDVESDLTKERRADFHRKLEEIKHQVSTRTSAVVELLQDCQHLMHELRIPEEESVLDRRIAGSLVRSKDGSFILASKLKTQTCVGIGPNVLEELTQRVTQLTTERKTRKVRLQEMGTEIATMWEKLQVSDEDQRKFTQGVQGLGMDTIVKGEEELRRLHNLKAEMLSKLISDARAAISLLWDETNTPQQQREMFSPYFKNDESQWNNELLDLHEEYIMTLETRLEQMKPILRILERREEILVERMEYERLQHNSERLQQRGAGLAKQLMREEKMAKRIKRELPKLTNSLQEKLQEWKKDHGEDFQFGGKVYLDVMTSQDKEWKEYKENEAKAKLQKKKEERELVENRFRNKSAYKPVNGKKGPSTKTRPLATRN